MRILFSQRDLIFLIMHPHALYNLPLVIQAHFDLLLFSGKPEFHIIIEILSLRLLKNTSF